MKKPCLKYDFIEREALGLFLFLIVFQFLFRLKSYIDPNIFQARDLYRAMKILSGHPILFGPEVTGGAHLPGSVVYYLMAGAMMFYQSWLSVWVLVCVMGALACVLLWRFLSIELSITAAFAAFFSIFFISSFQMIFTSFTNASLLPLFLVTSILLLLNNSTSSGSSLYWVLFCIVIGLGIQVHFTAIFIFISAIFSHLFFLNNKKDFSWKVFPLGIFCFLIVLLPYFFWKNGFFLVPSQQMVPEFSGDKYSILQSLQSDWSQWAQGWARDRLRWGASLPIELVNRFLSAGLIILSLSLVLTKLSNRLTILSSTQQLFLFIIQVCFYFSLLPLLAIFPYVDRVRYMSLLFISSYFLLGFIAYRLFNSSGKIKLFFISASIPTPVVLAGNNLFFLPTGVRLVLFFLIGVVFLYSLLKSQRLQNWFLLIIILILCEFNLSARESFLDLKGKSFVLDSAYDVARHIIRETGWPYEVAQKRIFLINISRQKSLEFVYREVYSSFLMKNRQQDITPTGYFVIHIKKRSEWRSLQKDGERWLLKQGLPKTLAAAIEDGSLPLGRPEFFSWGIILPYGTGKQGIISPLQFQNLGINSYELNSHVLPPPPGVHRRSDSEVAFVFNTCEKKLSLCSFVVSARRDRSEFLYITVMGRSLSFASPWLSPDWAEGINELYLQFRCEQQQTKQKILLASHIGDTPQSRMTMSLNSTLLAPYEVRVKNFCHTQPIYELSIGYLNSTVFSGNKYFEYGGQEMAIRHF